MAAASQQRAVVVGAGVVGLHTALALQGRGFAVTVIEARGPGEGTSRGNAGCIATAEISPISMPGLIWQVPRMLLDPLGPLSIRPAYLPKLLPWLWRFWRAGTRARVEAATAALAALVGRAWTDWDPVIAEAGLGDLVVRNGALFVYEGEASRGAAGAEWDVRRRHGVRAEPVDAAAIRTLEPDLAPRFDCGYFIPDWGHLRDPYRATVRLGEHFARRGGAIRIGAARDIAFAGNRPHAVILEDGSTVPFDRLAICAGAWSRDLCARLGHRVPLDTERGYNTTLPAPGVSLTRPVCPAAYNFMMTPMAMGLRIGGAVELAGLDLPPNFGRAKALLALGRLALPALDVAGGTEWMGFRPSMPDSLPVIGLSPVHGAVAFAFGHGHLGLTESATSGRLVADLLTGTAPPINLAPFRIDRF